MSLIGKKIIVEGANWGDIAISNLAYRIEKTDLKTGQSVNLYVWFFGGIDNNLTVSSSDTSLLTVGNRAGVGTEGRPFTYEVAAIDEGTATLTISSVEGIRRITMTIEESEVPAGYIQYAAIHVSDRAANSTVRCPVDDIKLSPDYSYEFNFRNNGYNNSQPLFGVRGYTLNDSTYVSNGKAFALFANKTTGTPAGAKIGFWWNGTDSNPIFNGLPADNNMYTITVTPNNNGATFSSTYNDATMNVPNTASVLEWDTGFAFFNYMQAHSSFGDVPCRDCSVGTTTIRDRLGEIIYKFVPVKDSNDKYGFYETVTKKFYPFNEDTPYYSSISGEIN